MSGRPMCASRAPSRKRTSEWTIEDGCTTTSIASYGSPNSQCASISSRPLFASVAESTVIFGPIRQVGWASACSAVTSASSSRVRPRNGPPDAVRTRPATLARSRPSRHWWSAECSLSTGQEQPSPTLLRGDGELAGGDEALLVRERERHTVLERPERRPDAGESDDGVQDDVGVAALQQSNGIAADLGVLDGMLGGELVERRRAGLERAQLELGMRGDDSIAWRPIEPVAPRIATRLTPKDA